MEDVDSNIRTPLLLFLELQISNQENKLTLTNSFCLYVYYKTLFCNFSQNDWREFECNTWHLEPTVRLISWAGSQIEPYGVDYILHKLGFSHARITIPKWLQRGCMDPLDKVLSMMVLKTIQAVKEEQEQKQHQEQLHHVGGGGASSSHR